MEKEEKRKGERKESGKKEKEKANEREKKRKNKKERECVTVRRKRDGERRKKKKGKTLPFAISVESAIETLWGKRESWSTQRELCVGTEIRIFCQS